MTTIINPGAGEAVVYNIDGIAIISLTCGPNGSPPTTVNRRAGRTVILASYVGPGNQAPGSFQIASGFDIGDVIEFYGIQPISSPQPPAPSVLLDENGNEMDIHGSIAKPTG